MRPSLLPIVLATLTAGCASHGASPAATPTPAGTPVEAYSGNGYRVGLVSSTNRQNVPGDFEGGWGPHLRSFLRDPNDALWYVIDVGANVEQNTDLDYYRLASSVLHTPASWQRVARQTQIPGIQQNVATVLAGATIYSYGVDVIGHQLEECRFDTLSIQAGGCATVQVAGQPLIIPPNSNYVGAALIPNGDRMVWWTTVASAAGTFSYVIDRPTGWTAPVVSDLGGYSFLGYVYVAFEDSTNLVLGGQVLTGDYHSPSYQLSAAIARLHLGDPLRDLSVIEEFAGAPLESTEDIWVDPPAGIVHFAGSGPGGQNVGTLSLTLAGWTSGTNRVANHVFAGTYRARFRRDSDGTLHLLMGASSRTPLGVNASATAPPLRDFSVSPTQAGTAIDWSAAPFRTVPMPTAAYTWIDGIWVESSVYQTTPVKSENFGFTGVVAETDNNVWHVQSP